MYFIFLWYCGCVLVQEISHDTKKFRFGLQSGSHILGLPVGTVPALFFLSSDKILVEKASMQIFLSEHSALLALPHTYAAV